jgi:hypothetical protein
MDKVQSANASFPGQSSESIRHVFTTLSFSVFHFEGAQGNTPVPDASSEGLPNDALFRVFCME